MLELVRGLLDTGTSAVGVLGVGHTGPKVPFIPVGFPRKHFCSCI